MENSPQAAGPRLDFVACGQGLATDDAFDRLLARLRREYVPYSALLELTHVCNLDCVMCYNAPLDQPELTTAEVLQLHGCVWAQSLASWIPDEAWHGCLEPDMGIPAGAEVVAGVDVGLRHDHSAVAVVWKDTTVQTCVIHYPDVLVMSRLASFVLVRALSRVGCSA